MPLDMGALALLEDAPALIVALRGPCHTVTFANAPARRAAGGSVADPVGLPAREAFPHLPDATIADLDAVLTTGEPRSGHEARLPVSRDGRISTGTFSYLLQPILRPDGTTDGILVHAVDLSEQALARDRTARLQSVTAALSRAMTEQQVAEVTVDAAMAALGAVAGALSLLRGGELEVVRAVGYPRSILARGQRMPLTLRRPQIHVVLHGEPVWLERVEDWTRLFGRPSSGLGAAGVALPIAIGAETVGVLGFRFGEDEHLFTPEERGMMLAMVRLCSQALERARLYDTERAARRAAQASEARAALIARAAAALDVEIGTRERLERLGNVIVPELADCCAIDLVDPSGGRRDLVVSHRDPAVAAGLAAMGERIALDPDSPYGPARALATGRSQLLGEIPPGLTDAVHERAGDRGLEILRAVAPRSAIVALLSARGRRLGTLTLILSRGERRYGVEDLRLAEELGRRAGTAVDNALLFEAEQAARREAERARERIARLQAVTAALSRALTAEAVGTVVLGEGGAAVQADAGAILLIGPSGETLERLASVGYPEEPAHAPELPTAAPTGPVGQALAEGLALASSTAQIGELWPERATTIAADGDQAIVCAALSIDGRAFGVLQLGFRAERDFSPRAVDFVRALARLCAQALERARLYEAQREVAEALQRSLLPVALPAVDGVEVAVRYRSSALPGEVGGDWYDVIALTDGRLGLTVGDVVGRGPAAAAVMGQLRSALHAFAMDGERPGRVLSRLSRFAQGVPGALVATAAYAILDPASGELRYSCAGHPPPLAVDADGTAHYLWEGRGAPLAVHLGAEYPEATARLQLGAALVLYSDGLVERSDEPLDEGFARLAAGVPAGPPPDPASLAAELLERALADDRPVDDTALLVARRVATAGRLERRVPALPGELAGLRLDVQRWLAAVGATAEEVVDLVLACGEATSNAVEHAYLGTPAGEVSLTAAPRADGMLEIVVRDRGRWREVAAPGLRGRGIGLMRGLVDTLELETDASGTTVTMRRRLAVRRPSHEEPRTPGGPWLDLRPPEGGGVVLARLGGELGLEGAGQIGERLGAGLAAGVSGLVVDLAEVTYLDSSMLRVLVDVADRAAGAGVALTIAAPPGSPARRALELSGLSGPLGAVDDAPDDATDDATDDAVDSGAGRGGAGLPGGPCGGMID